MIVDRKTNNAIDVFLRILLHSPIDIRLGRAVSRTSPRQPHQHAGGQSGPLENVPFVCGQSIIRSGSLFRSAEWGMTRVFKLKSLSDDDLPVAAGPYPIKAV